MIQQMSVRPREEYVSALELSQLEHRGQVKRKRAREVALTAMQRLQSILPSQGLTKL